jgi:hypothetical protein
MVSYRSLNRFGNGLRADSDYSGDKNIFSSPDQAYGAYFSVSTDQVWSHWQCSDKQAGLQMHFRPGIRESLDVTKKKLFS